MMTCSLETLYAIQVGEKQLIKPIKPIIQLQAHHFFYSSLDGKFHPMVLSQESISWGLQFSYPQLFQDPKTKTIAKVVDSEEFPNTDLFSRLQKKMRECSLATPFIIDGMRVNSPIRIGKQARTWINQHPQLQHRGIKVG
jgi:hypothetical protein